MALMRNKTPLTWPQYGISVRGPIKRERTFFFTNYEQTRNSEANILTVSPVNMQAVGAVLAARQYPMSLISTGTFPASIKTNFFLRLDYQLSPNDQIYVR